LLPLDMSAGARWNMILTPQVYLGKYSSKSLANWFVELLYGLINSRANSLTREKILHNR
jgi:hypothetical protein